MYYFIKAASSSTMPPWCNGITLASHVGERGSIPHMSNFVFFFVGIAQTLGAKITPFPRKDFGKNLPKWSTNSTCSFKPKKFTVGHFDLGRYVCLRNLDSVKDQKSIKSNKNWADIKIFRKGCQFRPIFCMFLLQEKFLICPNWVKKENVGL